MQKTFAKLNKPSNLEVLLHAISRWWLGYTIELWAVPRVGIRSPSVGGQSKELCKNYADEWCCGLLV